MRAASGRTGSLARALVARVRGGERLAELAVAEGVAPATPLPPAPLPPAALRARLGPAAFVALASLAPGVVAEPVCSPEGWWVVQLLERGPDEDPPLDAILPELRNLWIQRQHDRAIRAHLDALRERVAIEVVEPEG